MSRRVLAFLVLVYIALWIAVLVATLVGTGVL